MTDESNDRANVSMVLSVQGTARSRIFRERTEELRSDDLLRRGSLTIRRDTEYATEWIRLSAAEALDGLLPLLLLWQETLATQEK